jgi:hypothetical protein
MNTVIDRVRVASHSNETVSYVVTFVGNAAIACTCPHFNFRATDGIDADFSCKHMREAENALPLSKADLARIRQYLRNAR